MYSHSNDDTALSLSERARQYLAPEDVEVVLYHSPCFDGFSSALAAYQFLGAQARYIPMSYDKPIENLNLRDKNILVADFSFHPEVLKKLREQNKAVMILDHHKTALEELSNVDGVFLNMHQSGATLTFNYFNVANEPCPEFYTLVEDRDIWRWSFEERSKPLAALMSKLLDEASDKFNYDFHAYAPLLDADKLDIAIDQGKNIITQQDSWVKNKSKAAEKRTLVFSGQSYVVGFIELKTSKLISELGHYLCQNEEIDFAMLVVRDKDSYKISLRSIGLIDVSTIAQHFGGGGHRNAAGFFAESLPTFE